MSYCEILIGGRNRELLFQKLRKANILLLNIKEIDEKTMIIRVPQKDYKKVFAICGNMWYNKLIKYGGLYGILNFVKKRICLILGLIIFIASVFYSNNLILDIEFVGLTKVSTAKAQESIQDIGVKKYGNFNDINLQSVEKNILSLSDEITFVTAKKSVNRLIITVFEENKGSKLIDFAPKNIVASESGTIKKITVFRGTAKREVGDKVLAGEVLIEGSFIANENIYQTCALGSVILESQIEWEYPTAEFNKTNEQLAVSKARFLAGDKNITDVKVSQKRENGSLLYCVNITYLVEIGG